MLDGIAIEGGKVLARVEGDQWSAGSLNIIDGEVTVADELGLVIERLSTDVARNSRPVATLQRVDGELDPDGAIALHAEITQGSARVVADAELGEETDDGERDLTAHVRGDQISAQTLAAFGVQLDELTAPVGIELRADGSTHALAYELQLRTPGGELDARGDYDRVRGVNLRLETERLEPARFLRSPIAPVALQLKVRATPDPELPSALVHVEIESGSYDAMALPRTTVRGRVRPGGGRLDRPAGREVRRRRADRERPARQRRQPRRHGRAIVFNVYLDTENLSLVFGSPASDNISTTVTTSSNNSPLELLVQDFAVIMIIATIMLLISYKLKQSAVIGYIIAGMIIGPYTPPFSLIHNIDTLNAFAELGIIMLLFVIGTDFPIKRLRSVGRISATVAIVESMGTLLITFIVAQFLGFAYFDSLFIALALSITSTAVTIKVLEELGMIRDKSTTLLLGISIVEDILAITVLGILQSVAIQEGDLSFVNILTSIMIIGAFIGDEL